MLYKDKGFIMEKLVFDIEFLSDIVLQSTSNTEGKIDPLEFIPGSVFLGMVAKNYDKFEDSFKIFHSGLVRFMDANLVFDNKLFYKTPYSYFKKKILQEDEEPYIYNHHLINSINENLGQLKQLRKGFIDPNRLDNLNLYEIKYNYSQKSSYDKTKRRSKSGNMYGYKAMPKGLKWQFQVKFDKSICDKDIDLVIKTLEDSTRIGKSKSSEYGKVKITQSNDLSQDLEEKSNDNLTYIYANSRLALIDECGNPSLDPIHLISGLKKENIDYSKTQIKISTYRQYNTTIKNRSFERVVINKGSVLVLRDLDSNQKEQLRSGIGGFLSEGFGDVLINPIFLLEPKMKLIKKSKINKGEEFVDKIKVNFADNTLNYLKAKHNRRLEKLDLVDSIYRFIAQNKQLYENINNSQWGTIRSICISNIENKIDKIKDYISSGKVKWSKEQQDKLINNSLEFIQLLAIEMPKAHNRGVKNAK